jgi:hypothetical protein
MKIEAVEIRGKAKEEKLRGETEKPTHLFTFFFFEKENKNTNKPSIKEKKGI